MKDWYVDRVVESPTRTCKRCGHPLAWVEDVGWVDTSDDAYDMCEADPYGSHLPERLPG